MRVVARAAFLSCFVARDPSAASAREVLCLVSFHAMGSQSYDARHIRTPPDHTTGALSPPKCGTHDRRVGTPTVGRWRVYQSAPLYASEPMRRGRFAVASGGGGGAGGAVAGGDGVSISRDASSLTPAAAVLGDDAPCSKARSIVTNVVERQTMPSF